MTTSELNGRYRANIAGAAGVSTADYVVRDGFIYGNDAGSAKYFGRIWFGRSHDELELEMDASLFEQGWLVQDGLPRPAGFEFKLRFSLTVSQFGQPQVIGTPFGPVAVIVVRLPDRASKLAA